MSSNTNNLCWCGSGLLYTKCHAQFDKKLDMLKSQGFPVPSRKIIKSKKEIVGIKKSCKVNTAILNLVSKIIQPGISTEDIDELVHALTLSLGATPAPLNFQGYPKSICTSINNEVCHGIPNENTILKNGDIVNVDVSTILNGYYSDASRMFIIGNATEEAKRLVKISKECLYKGISAVKPWGLLSDIGSAIESHAEKNGYSVVRGYGGHGIGLDFHEEPFVASYRTKGLDMVLVPGMVFTIEPIINTGSPEIIMRPNDDWTVFTRDGSLSSQWEHTVLVTNSGVEILCK